MRALFSAVLAPRWTPELKVRGTVAYAPAARLDEQAPLTRSITTPSGLTGLVAMIVRGVDIAAPSLNVTALLGDQAQALYPRTLTECLPQLGAADSFGGLAPKDLFRDGADLAPALKALDASDPANLTIRTPVLIEQGEQDTTVFKIFTDQVNTELVKRKAKVKYRVYPGVDHGGIVTAAAKASTTWIGQRLR
jgi:pimeloyl-ACP methyl ester carboxylesterase